MIPEKLRYSHHSHTGGRFLLAGLKAEISPTLEKPGFIQQVRA